VYGLDEPTALAPLKAADRVNYRLGLPHPGEATGSLLSAVRDAQSG
jgi:hypothetical protein